MSGSKEGYLFIYKQVVSCPNKQHSFESFTCLVRKNASRLCLVQINRVLWNLLRVWCERRLFIYIQASCVLSKKNQHSFESFTCLVQNNAMYLYIYIYISRLCLVHIKSVLLNLSCVWIDGTWATLSSSPELSWTQLASALVRPGAASALVRPGAASALVRPGAASALVRPGAASALVRPGAASALVRPGAACGACTILCPAQNFPST